MSQISGTGANTRKCRRCTAIILVIEPLIDCRLADPCLNEGGLPVTPPRFSAWHKLAYWAPSGVGGAPGAEPAHGVVQAPCRVIKRSGRAPAGVRHVVPRLRVYPWPVNISQ